MTWVNATPEAHHVFNELDQQGLLLGLERLEEERNTSYKQRLLDIMARRAGSSYIGLINGITRELGLEIFDAIEITALTDDDGETLATYPAVVFQDTKCTLYNDFTTDDILLEIDRFELLDGSYIIKALIDTINATGYYQAAMVNGANPYARSMTIFNQSSIGTVTAESISSGGLHIRLENTNLVPGTISIRSQNLITRVSSSDNLQTGEYFIDEESGTLISAQAPADGSFIRYRYSQNTFVAQASPVIIHTIQSDDFKTKMFRQLVTDDGTSNGLPTALGADLICELLSVYPMNWGT